MHDTSNSLTPSRAYWNPSVLSGSLSILHVLYLCIELFFSAELIRLTSSDTRWVHPDSYIICYKSNIIPYEKIVLVALFHEKIIEPTAETNPKNFKPLVEHVQKNNA